MANTPTSFGQQAGSYASSPEFKDKAQETGTAVAEKAKEVAATAADKTKQVAGAAADKAREVAATVGHKAEDAKAAVGSGMQSLAHGLESGGRYLQQEDFRHIAADVTNVIRRNPIPAMLVGVGLGFLLSRALRS
jgi:hypothetical protein